MYTFPSQLIIIDGKILKLVQFDYNINLLFMEQVLSKEMMYNK